MGCPCGPGMARAAADPAGAAAGISALEGAAVLVDAWLMVMVALLFLDYCARSSANRYGASSASSYSRRSIAGFVIGADNDIGGPACGAPPGGGGRSWARGGPTGPVGHGRVVPPAGPAIEI